MNEYQSLVQVLTNIKTKADEKIQLESGLYLLRIAFYNRIIVPFVYSSEKDRNKNYYKPKNATKGILDFYNALCHRAKLSELITKPIEIPKVVPKQSWFKSLFIKLRGKECVNG